MVLGGGARETALFLSDQGFISKTTVFFFFFLKEKESQIYDCYAYSVMSDSS